MPNEQTPSSTDTLVSSMSFSEIEKLVKGESLSLAGEPVPVIPDSSQEPPAEAAPAPVAATAEPPAAEPGTPKTEGEGATPEPNQEPKPKEKWYDKRLSQLAHKRDEERTAREAAERNAEQLRQELAALKAGKPGPTSPADTEPKPATDKPEPELMTYVDALKDGDKYEDAVQRYTKAVIERTKENLATEVEARLEAKQTAKAQATAEQTQAQQFQKDWEAGRAEHPDFDEIVDRVRTSVPEGLQKAISNVTDDDGKNLWPGLVAYLDENPDQLAALSKQYGTNQIAAVAKLGRIAASLSPQAPTPATQPAARVPAAAAPRAAIKPPVAVGSTPTPAPVDIEKVKDIDVVGRELNSRYGLKIPGFGS